MSEVEYVKLDKNSYIAILNNIEKLLDTELRPRQINVLQDTLDMLGHTEEEHERLDKR